MDHVLRELQAALPERYTLDSEIARTAMSRVYMVGAPSGGDGGPRYILVQNFFELVQNFFEQLKERVGN